MLEILQAGNAKSTAHLATIPITPLEVDGLPPGRFMFFVTTASGIGAPAGGHMQGFNMGGANNRFITGIIIWTDEAISDLAWMVVGTPLPPGYIPIAGPPGGDTLKG
jgi:hypothetical protein